MYHIYGGNNVIAETAQTINQAGRDVITTGDITLLTNALLEFGVEAEDANQIVQALNHDGHADTPSLGQRTLAAIKGASQKVVTAGKKITTSAATSIVTQMVLRYLGAG